MGKVKQLAVFKSWNKKTQMPYIAHYSGRGLRVLELQKITKG